MDKDFYDYILEREKEDDTLKEKTDEIFNRYYDKKINSNELFQELYELLK